MSRFRKQNNRQPDETPDIQPDSSSPFASFEAAWRAEDDVELQRQRERLSDPGLSLEPLRGVFTRRRIISFLIIVLLLVLVWASTIGPLVPVIASLKGLPGRVIALIPATETASPTPVPPTPVPTPTLQSLPPTFTPAPEESVTPTLESLLTQPVVAPEITSTPEPTILPTSQVAGCTPSESVTLDDVGKTMCVTGKVIQTIERTSSFSILVGTRKDSFFYVSYEKTYNLNKGTCVFANGEIVQLGQNPIMLVGFLTPLELCNP